MQGDKSIPHILTYTVKGYSTLKILVLKTFKVEPEDHSLTSDSGLQYMLTDHLSVASTNSATPAL
jgi:hypothetical protein